MDKINFSLSFAVALIPIFIGMIWYSKMMFGNAWMKSAKISAEEGKGGNMVLLLVVAYIFSLMISFAMYGVTIHQMGVYSTLANDPGFMDPTSPTGAYLSDFMSKYGNNFRTFKHGALHGTMAALFIALPVVGTSALFERRGFKYIAIHAGYWIVSLALVGGVICAYA